MKWIIYVLKNPRTNEVRYVGWTKQSANRRMNTQIQQAVNKPPTTHRTKWILSLLCIGVRPVMEVIEFGIGDGWAAAERRWIAEFLRKGARLTNATEGGEGTIGLMPSARARELSSQRRKGQALTPEHVAKWHAAALAANLGRPLSKEHRDKLSALYKGKKRPPGATAPMLAARIAQIREHGVSADTRAKISAFRTGLKASAKTRAKMSTSRLRYLASRSMAATALISIDKKGGR